MARYRALLTCFVLALTVGGMTVGAQGCNAIFGLNDLKFGDAGAPGGAGGAGSTTTATATGTGGTGGVKDAGPDVETDADAGGCANDKDCQGNPSGAFCDTATSMCVQCLAAHPCPTGEYCDTSNSCQPGCTSNADCNQGADGGMGTDGGGTDGGGTGGAGTGGGTGGGDGGLGQVDAGTVTCDVSTHTCVGCAYDAECPLGTICMGGSCLGGCSATHGCQAGHSCCSGKCLVTNTTDSVTACGACAIACSSIHGTPSCVGGTCQIACNAGYGDCDGNAGNGCETSVEGDPTNCGACGMACGNANTTAVACTAGACQLTCTAGFGNCDGNGANGCEAPLGTTTNCGTCGGACSFANAQASCTNMVCTLGPCNAGFANCDGNTSTGCNVSLSTDPQNCGGCGTMCSTTNNTPTCAGGACVVSCAAGFGNCDGDVANGCEASLGTTTNCGACGAACTNPNGATSCTSGACKPTCAPGFADCDGNPNNGCETNTQQSSANCGACLAACTNANGATSCAGGKCAPVCSTGFADCDGNTTNGCETNTQTSTANCGGCGMACTNAHGSTSCAAGACKPICAAGFADCDGDPTNGCETSTTTTSNCGTCGNACSSTNDSPTCAAGACVLSCSAGFGNCSGTTATGCETNLNTSANNCGACGHVCTCANGTPNCVGGVCGCSSCTAPFGNCAGTGCNVNLSNDPLNCGGCGQACSTNNDTPSCSSGTCHIACNAGFGDCDANVGNGCEANLGTSVQNCGTCGNACSTNNATPSCNGGSCSVSCNAGFGNCDGNVANGCETPINTITNCGACGVACTNANGGTSCGAGKCVPTCTAGFGDCDGNPNNGCEANLATSVTSCGACGVACTNANGTTSCSGGACHPICAAGYADCDGNPDNGCETSITTASHCGACGVACTQENGTNSCVSGACVPTCSSGFGDCDGNHPNGCEANLNTDPNNCGGCGIKCVGTNGANACVNGVCVPSCNAGFGDCDGNPDNGCETNLGTDANNCGMCNSACTALNGTNPCVAGACKPSCNAGFADCDGNADNGCETNTTSNVNHCGACGTVCGSTNATASCNNGTCTEACSTGFSNCDGAPGNGCECAGTTCCGTSCQVKHNNGFGGFYYDCSPVGPPVTQQMAIDACTSVTGSASLCTQFGCTGSGANSVICTPAAQNLCWDYTGSHAGYAETAGQCPGNDTSHPWN